MQGLDDLLWLINRKVEFLCGLPFFMHSALGSFPSQNGILDNFLPEIS